MKIKQQNQIKTFLIEEFGVDNGNTLFAKQEKILNEIIKNTKNKSKNQMETLIQTILPRIALYKALEEGFDEEKVYQHMQKYMSRTKWVHGELLGRCRKLLFRIHTMRY